MTQDASVQCSDEIIQQVLAIAGEDAANGVAAIERILPDYPGDARLHFLKGSLLIGLKRFIGAHQALKLAVEFDPDYPIARFQLGFFELTSGEADAALRTWEPLKALPATSWLCRFVDGLEHLAADRFEQCIASLRAGIEANQENIPLNADMQLIIDKCAPLISGRKSGDGTDTGEISATSLLLGTGGQRSPNGGR